MSLILVCCMVGTAHLTIGANLKSLFPLYLGKNIPLNKIFFFKDNVTAQALWPVLRG